ncbi:MAG TPA: hypothetical protein VGX71_11570 [Pseudaminobacter sp.]|nr:hypothetical protein [Pseudaminobacter sp.]
MRHEVFTPAEAAPVGFWVFDDPEDGKLHINQDFSAIGQAAVKGATLFMVNTDTPGHVFERGANLWLNSKGRNCTVTSIERIFSSTNYEASYICR